jgi:mRNA interferase YafQ
MLVPEYTSGFERDVKRMARKHMDTEGLRRVIRLVLADNEESRDELRRRHRAHRLTGDWSGVLECHIDNSLDSLLIWRTSSGTAVFLRVGSHDELFH